MSMEVFVEAIGKIDDELVDEFYSCETSKKIPVYTMMKIMAAAIAAVISIGAAVTWIGNTRGTKPEDGPIVAIEESEKPLQTEVPTVEPIETPVETPTPIPTEEVTVEPIVSEETVVTEETAPIPSENVIPSNGDESTIAPSYEQNTENLYVAWNQSANQIQPCNPFIEQLEAEVEWEIRREEMQNNNTHPGYAEKDAAEAARPEDENSVDSQYVPPHEWAEDDPRFEGWIKNVILYSPVYSNWYWFNTKNIEEGIVWKDYYITQTDKEGIGSYSNVLLLKEKNKVESGALYIMQVQTGALTLKEANDIYYEPVFTNVQTSYYNGMDMYFVETAAGEHYIRFLIGDTLITIVDKGFGKDYVMELIQHVKKKQVLDWKLPD